MSKPNKMPDNPKMMMDDDIEEVTRRVGGRGAGTSMVSPNFGAMPNPMEMPGFAGTINTAPIKASSMGLTMEEGPQVFIWELNQVPTLPEMYPLERSAVFVPRTSPSTVAARVSDVLRDHSIEATYDDHKAKVKCVTTDGVDFRIRLYRGRDQYSHGIIVEVQRRFGASIRFHHEVQSILDAAEGKEPMPVPPRSNLPMVTDDEEDEVPAPPTGSSSSLAMVSKMMSLPGYDAQLLGLSTLSSLVDSNKMGPATAKSISLQLLQPDSHVGAQVLKFILARPKASPAKEMSSDDSDDEEDDSAMSLRVLALSVLALSVKASGSTPEFLRSVVRPVLLQDLEHAEEHPRCALYAAKAMEPFCKGDENVQELKQVLEISLKVGQARYKELMRASERCLLKLR